MAQHPSERETSSRRRQAKGPGLGESTHPTRRALGMVALRQIPTATGTAASLLASLRKKGFQSCKNNNKSSKNSRFSLFFFFCCMNKLEEKERFKENSRKVVSDAGRDWCLLFALLQKRKTSERLGENSMLRFNQENKSGQLSITRHRGGGGDMTIKVIYWKLLCCYIASIFHSQIMIYVASITNREKNTRNIILIYNVIHNQTLLFCELYMFLFFCLKVNSNLKG